MRTPTNTTIISDALKPAEQYVHSAEALRHIRDLCDQLAEHYEDVARDQLGDLASGAFGEQLISAVREAHCEQIANLSAHDVFAWFGDRLETFANELDNDDPDGPGGGGPGGGNDGENPEAPQSAGDEADGGDDQDNSAADVSDQDGTQAGDGNDQDDDQLDIEQTAAATNETNKVAATQSTTDGGSGTDDKTSKKGSNTFFNFGPDAERVAAAERAKKKNKGATATGGVNKPANNEEPTKPDDQQTGSVEPLPDDGRPSHKRVYDALSRLIEAGEIAPKNSRIAEIANCKPGTVGASLSKLFKLGSLDYGENGYRYHCVHHPDGPSGNSQQAGKSESVEIYGVSVPAESEKCAEAIVGEAYEDAGDPNNDGSNPYVEQGGWKEAVYRAAFDDMQKVNRAASWETDHGHASDSEPSDDTARREAQDGQPAAEGQPEQPTMDLNVDDGGDQQQAAETTATDDQSSTIYPGDQSGTTAKPSSDDEKITVNGETVPASEKETARQIVIEATDDASDPNYNGENRYRNCRGTEAWKRRLYKRVYQETEESVKQNAAAQDAGSEEAEASEAEPAPSGDTADAETGADEATQEASDQGNAGVAEADGTADHSGDAEPSTDDGQADNGFDAVAKELDESGDTSEATTADENSNGNGSDVEDLVDDDSVTVPTFLKE